SWKILQDFSSTKKVEWKPTKSGIYTIKVHAKHQLSLNDSESEKELTYVVFEPATLQNIMTNQSNLLSVNNTVNISASAQNQEDFLYRYLIYNGTQLIHTKSYSHVSDFEWTPTEPGAYHIKVEVKHKLS